MNEVVYCDVSVLQSNGHISSAFGPPIVYPSKEVRYCMIRPPATHPTAFKILSSRCSIFCLLNYGTVFSFSTFSQTKVANASGVSTGCQRG